MVTINRYRLATMKLLPGQSMQEFVAGGISIINQLKAAGIEFKDDTELSTWVLNGLPPAYQHEKVYLPRDPRKMQSIGLLLNDLYLKESALLNQDNQNQISELSHTVMNMSVRDEVMKPVWVAPMAGHLSENAQGASTSTGTGRNTGRNTGGNGGWNSNTGWRTKKQLVCWACNKEGHKAHQCPTVHKRGVQQYKDKGPRGHKRKDREDNGGRDGGNKRHKGNVRFAPKSALKKDGNKPKSA